MMKVIKGNNFKIQSQNWNKMSWLTIIRTNYKTNRVMDCRIARIMYYF